MAFVEPVQVKSELLEPVTVKNEPVDVTVKTEGAENSELYHLPEQSSQPQESKQPQQTQTETQQSKQPQQSEQPDQSKEQQQPEQPEQPEQAEQPEQETGVETGVLQEAVTKEVQNDQNDQIPVAVAVAVMNTPSVMNASLSVGCG